MNARNLILICGMAATMIGSANAQTGTTQPATPAAPATQPGDRKVDRDRPIDTTQPRAAAASPSVLRDLEGIWRVEVTINPVLWKQQHGGHDDAPKSKITGAPDVNDNPSGEPKRPDADKNKPSDPNAAFKSTGKTCEAYAERKLILGSNILQETILAPEMWKDDPANPANPANPAGDASAKADNAFRGMSLLSFDDATRTYQAVFIDSRSGRMHHDIGTFQASSNRIVFDGDDRAALRRIDSAPRPMEPDRKPDGEPRDKDLPRDKNMGKHHGMENVRVVLEVLDSNSHRVTMYAVGPNRSADRTDRDREHNADLNNDGKPDVKNLNDNDPMKPIAGAPADGSIIYQATYTRAQGADASRYQRMLQDQMTLRTR